MTFSEIYRAIYTRDESVSIIEALCQLNGMNEDMYAAWCEYVQRRLGE